MTNQPDQRFTMILTGNKIKKENKKGNITINPFDCDNISTNSYDLALGNTYIEYAEEIIDPKRNNDYSEKTIPESGLLLDKGSFILASSQEKIGSDQYVPIIHAKSSIARLGLFVHVTADLIDIGSHGTVTFQLYATSSVRIYQSMKIGQVSFWVPKGNISLYDGKYANSNGPQPSKSYLSFKD